MNKHSIKKLIVVGLDGATFAVLDPYMGKGDMPNLRKMCTAGVHGELRSTIPPVTGPSWASFMTGKNPGKHGVFDFVRSAENDIRRYPVNYKHIRSKTIWDMVGESGKKVGVINMPLTYPPPSINGFVITGLLTPPDVKKISYPEDLITQINEQVGPYTLDVWWQDYGESGAERFLNDLLRCTEERIRTIEYLMKNQEWDLFVPVFIGADRIQHFLWKYIHPEDTDDLTEREIYMTSQIKRYYRIVDLYIGRILAQWGEDSNILVISDHGFGPLRKKMYVNWWLHEMGYLSLKHSKRHVHLLLRNGIVKLKNIVRRFDRYNIRGRILPSIRRRGPSGAYKFLNVIDWSETKAYSVSNTEQGIYLNLRGREPGGIVSQGAEYESTRDKIIGDLKLLRDLDTREPLVTHIYKREEVYQGPYLRDAPDIIFFLKGGEYLADVRLKAQLFEDANWTTGWGTHRMEGIMVGYGPDIKERVNVKGAQMIDMAPTILRLLDIPIPRDMDGKVLEDIIDNDFLQSHEEIYSDGEGAVVDTEADHVLSEEDTAEMERCLRGLGYL